MLRHTLILLSFKDSLPLRHAADAADASPPCRHVSLMLRRGYALFVFADDTISFDTPPPRRRLMMSPFDDDTLRAAAAIFALRHAFSFTMFRYAADAAAMPFRRRHAAATMKRQIFRLISMLIFAFFTPCR